MFNNKTEQEARQAILEQVKEYCSLYLKEESLY